MKDAKIAAEGDRHARGQEFLRVGLALEAQRVAFARDHERLERSVMVEAHDRGLGPLGDLAAQPLARSLVAAHSAAAAKTRRHALRALNEFLP